MAQIIIQFPDGERDRILNALCYEWAWDASLGVTKAAFVKSHIVRWLAANVRSAERRLALRGTEDSFDQTYQDPGLS